jgi:hypothetical protein
MIFPEAAVMRDFPFILVESTHSCFLKSNILPAFNPQDKPGPILMHGDRKPSVFAR